MAKKIKALHALNWYYGNICSRKCAQEKQKERYDRMRKIIKGHEEYLITHKMFIRVMHEKHHVCGLSDAELRQPTRNFWRLPCLR